MANPAITVPEQELVAFCQRWHITWLALFGSVLSDQFRPDSDVDVLVEFENGQTPGLAMYTLENELSELFGGRKVDVIIRRELNRWIRDRVLAEAQVQYAEG